MDEKSLLWVNRNKKEIKTRNVGSWFNTTVLACLGLFLNVDYGFAFSCRVKNRTAQGERLLVEER